MSVTWTRRRGKLAERPYLRLVRENAQQPPEPASASWQRLKGTCLSVIVYFRWLEDKEQCYKDLIGGW
jgi:hypothetical protein